MRRVHPNWKDVIGMLKQWKENFKKASDRAQKIERRALRADAELKKREDEMLAWARSKAASPRSILSGMY